MAQKVNIVLIDDIDGSEAVETVSFGLDGTTYEIDLNKKNAAALRDAIGQYVAHARKVTGGGRRGGRRSSSTNIGPSARECDDRPEKGAAGAAEHALRLGRHARQTAARG